LNLYVLVEGEETERKVYRAWFSHFFPRLVKVDRIEDIQDNHYFMITGDGYPKYVDKISAALKDVRNHEDIDHLFICVDAEELSFEEKLAEIEKVVAAGPVPRSCFIIVQDCCIETWFLGNGPFMRKNPQSEALRKWKEFYDVSQDDPEKIPHHPGYVTRAQSHLAYLKEMMRERNRAYSKTNPGPVIEMDYFEKLVSRNFNTGHLRIFGRLVSVWRDLGANL